MSDSIMNVQVTDFTPFKLLLKQVYSAHTSRVKELESEVKSLKVQLSEMVKVPLENVPDCKRCTELEAAFKSCQKALQEQTKLFETFGQKFSIFNGSDPGTQEFGIASKSTSEITSLKLLASANSVLDCNKNRSTILPVEEKVADQLPDKSTLKITVPSNENLLKKFMCDDGGLCTLDMCAVAFPENQDGEHSNKKWDYTIFAPDSLEVGNGKRKNVDSSTKCTSKEQNNKVLSCMLDKSKATHSITTKSSGKRLSSDSFEENQQTKHHKNNSSEDLDVTFVANNQASESDTRYSKNPTIKSTSPNSLQREKTMYDKDKRIEDIGTAKSINISKPEPINAGLDLHFSTTLKNATAGLLNREHNKQHSKIDSTGDLKVNSVAGDKPSIQKNLCLINSTDIIAKEKNVLNLDTKKSKLPKADENVVDILASKTLVTPKSSLCPNLVNEVKKINSPFETSPSLLPKTTNIVPKIIDSKQLSNDIEDFIENNLNSKLLQCEDSWDVCDKRKTLKKSRTAKTLKCTSNYKMTLDSPPLNYKKPSYKQSKLSKSFFQGKASFNAKVTTKTSTEKNIKNEQETIPTVVLDEFQTSMPCVGLKSSPIDIDATYIPENYQCEISPLGTALVKRNTVEKSNLKNGSLFSDISFPGGLKSSSKPGPSNTEDIFVEEFENSASFEEDELKEDNVNSFDRLPVVEEPNYKYKNDVVRKKAERRQLNGFDCKECEKYYSDLGLSTKEKKERMKKCSRHRAKFAPSNTPDNFWELDFPDTEECKARGYMDKTQKVKLNQLCDM